VKWRIKLLRTGKYWDGSGYTSADYNIDEENKDSAWFVVQTTESFKTWYDTFSFISDEEYQIEVYAQDSLGNYSSAYSTVTFTFDTDLPIGAISYPSNRSVVKQVNFFWNIRNFF